MNYFEEYANGLRKFAAKVHSEWLEYNPPHSTCMAEVRLLATAAQYEICSRELKNSIAFEAMTDKFKEEK